MDDSILPDGFAWIGAVFIQDGFNGRACLANVAKDQDGTLWCFVPCGRYRIQNDYYLKYKVSSLPFAEAPIGFSPMFSDPEDES